MNGRVQSGQHSDPPANDGGPSELPRAYLARREDLIRYFSARLRSREAAEDLIQDLFVRVSSLETGPPIDNPSAYLFRLAHNMMLDRLRSSQRSGARDEAWRRTQSAEFAGQDIVDAASPEQAAEASERLRRTIVAIQGLPPRTRRAFEMHRLEGLSQEQTAQALGVSRKTVEKQVSAALKHLLAKLRKAER